MHLHSTKIAMSTVINKTSFNQGSGSGVSGPFSMEAEAEAQKIYRFGFHTGYLT